MDTNENAVILRLLRSVIGRKIMEVEDFSQKSRSDDPRAAQYAAMVTFLANDIAGYKSIVEDLKDGSCDLTGDLYDIASLPPELVDLYKGFYLPLLSADDLEDEKAAMDYKVAYAATLANTKLVEFGRRALSDEMALGIMMGKPEISAQIGAIVLNDPELSNLLQGPDQ